MEIEIPDTLTLYTEEHRSDKWHVRYYCFPHAVLRALEGEKIRVKVEGGVTEFCHDCKEFGAPRTHDLGSLRR